MMEIALLARMRIKVEFDQGTSINGIYFKAACRCCGMTLFKDPDEDSKGFVSFFGTLEDAILSLPMS